MLDGTVEQTPLSFSQSLGHPALCRAIAQAICDRPEQCISFAEFMQMALYHPLYGYYAAGKSPIGAEGDFVTSAYLAPDFGELIATQIAQIWEILGYPNPFVVVEIGAGQGLLVRDIMYALHRNHFSCFECLQYRIIESSPAVVGEQQRRFTAIVERWGNLHWSTWTDLASAEIVGCFISNELVDAFPVHRVVLDGGKLREIYVTMGDRPVDSASNLIFAETIGDLSTPQLQNYFDWLGIDLASRAYANGYQTEVNLAALDWMATVSDRLQRGYVITIDYGYPAERYYSPVRSAGTLQCYSQQAHYSDPYQLIGQQDITAHVDFTALQRKGEQCGLQTVGMTKQGLFLMALGLGDRIAALSQPNPELTVNDVLRQREALHGLIDPMGLGNFTVLIQSKGLSKAEQQIPLNGLSIPPLT
jgi:SAM-dependent MidA family methyltransferase